MTSSIRYRTLILSQTSMTTKLMNKDQFSCGKHRSLSLCCGFPSLVNTAANIPVLLWAIIKVLRGTTIHPLF